VRAGGSTQTLVGPSRPPAPNVVSTRRRPVAAGARHASSRVQASVSTAMCEMPAKDEEQLRSLTDCFSTKGVAVRAEPLPFRAYVERRAPGSLCSSFTPSVLPPEASELPRTPALRRDLELDSSVGLANIPQVGYFVLVPRVSTAGRAQSGLAPQSPPESAASARLVAATGPSGGVYPRYPAG
jgi:hypothetical protein